MITNISLFENVSVYVGEENMDNIIRKIKSDCYKQQISVYREILRTGMKKQADGLKKNLPGFTPSGTFPKGRKADLITSYSGYLVLDLDKLSPEDLQKAKETVKEIPFTYAAFVSPSGNGLKIIVPVDSSLELHRVAMSQVVSYYENALQLTVDPSGKDVSRLCFVSHDPDCYHNQNADTFKVKILLEKIEAPVPAASQPQKEESSRINNAATTPFEHFDVFRDCVSFTEQKLTFVEGNRNNFIHLLACNCNRNGIPLEIAENLILQNYTLEQPEASKSINSAYANNKHDHATIAKVAKSEINSPFSQSANSEESENNLMNMPFLPDDIFGKLPSILKEGAEVLHSKRERDVFMTGALAILSGCMSNVIGLYNGKENRANLYVFIVAPAATGKGALVHAKELGIAYHSFLLNESQQKRKVFNFELQAYKKKMYDKKVSADEISMPEEPPFKILYIPANSSSSKVIEHLKEGDQRGVFCETEADSMGNTLKQDWGGYSDLLRKAFHHEPVSFSRRANKEYIEVNTPCLSVALAGTPGQVENLIKSVEDGLFSRFMFYTFRGTSEWNRAGETMNGVNLTSHYQSLSYRVLDFVNFYENNPKCYFRLTNEQWDKLNEFGENSLLNNVAFVSDELSSTSKRLGLILLRIAMILTSLRYFDNGEIAAELWCTDEDFDIALQLVKVYEQHAIYMFNALPKKSQTTDKIQKAFFDSLPDTFQRKEAIELADTIHKIAKRTADLYLAKFEELGLLDKPKTGFYQKIKK